MLTISLLFSFTVGSLGILWSKQVLNDVKKSFYNVSTSTAGHCGVICQQFPNCDKFGFQENECFCLHDLYGNSVELINFYQRDLGAGTLLATLTQGFTAIGYKIYEDVWYGLKMMTHQDKAQWSKAETDCYNEGGQLYTMYTPVKRQLLDQFLNDISYGIGKKFYVGLHKKNDTWLWIDNSTDQTYLQTEHQSQDCAVFSTNSNENNLTSYPCNNIEDFLCEVKLG